MLAMIGLSANGHMEFFSNEDEIHQCCSSTSCSSSPTEESESEKDSGLCNPLDGCPNCMLFLKAQVLLPFQEKPSIVSRDWIYAAQQELEYYTSDDPPPKG